MLRTFQFIIAIIILQSWSFAQYKRHLVEFTDKGNNSYSISSPIDFLSTKAILRRTNQALSIDSTDLPVSGYYLDSLKKINGLKLISASKWLNRALIEVTDQTVLNKLQLVSFIKQSAPIASIKAPSEISPPLFKSNETINKIQRPLLNGTRSPMGMEENINYGNSFAQVHMHNGEYLHQKGFTGTGVVIAVLDGGFDSYDSNISFDSLRLQQRLFGGYDFVENKNEISEAHIHGSYCLSIMASNISGSMVGSAPHASYYLLRTENDAEEYPVEEFFWALGAEYADSVGADIISSSLGYTSFSDPAFNHSYAERDGNTTLSAIAADLAARKGMIVCNSAGNSGTASTDERYISSPADGDSVLAVGAVRVDGTIAAFSSWGPNGAGKIKPDVVSLGQGTVFTNAKGEPVTGNGTSFSNPNIAGLVACLWQAFPEMNNMEIINVVKQSAHLYANPDEERYGYGIPDFKMAFEKLQDLRIQRNLEQILTTTWIKAFPNPFQNNLSIAIMPGNQQKAVLRLFDAKGAMVHEKSLTLSQGIPMVVEFRNLPLANGIYMLQYIDEERKTSIRIVKN